MIKLYKFRPLATKDEFDNAKKILEDDQFHCAQFMNLNDPLEGVFYITIGDPRLEDQGINDIYSEKSRYRICSFSGKKAFANPAMWGYYANGFKGITVEIEIKKKDVNIIDYVPDIINIRDLGKANIVEKIITTKLTCWNHEEEYRFLIQSNEEFHRIGDITAVYFGNPYGNVENSQVIFNDIKSLKEYNDKKKDLIKVARDKDIKCYSVKIERGRVIVDSVLTN